MNADLLFRSVAFFLIGVCFTMVIMSFLNQANWMKPSCDFTESIELETQTVHNGHNSTIHLQPSYVSTHSCAATAWLPPFRVTKDLFDTLRAEKMKVGMIEYGPNGVEFIQQVFSAWRTMSEIVVVDENMASTTVHDRLRELGKQTETFSICQNTSTNCAAQYADEYFDFIYLSGQYDRTGTHYELAACWRKLKPRGIIAGSNYVALLAPKSVNSSSPMIVPNIGAIKEVVNDFFSDQTGHMKGCPRQVLVAYRESLSSGWAARK